MTLTTERQQFAEQNEMSMDFVNWFFDEKKESFGNMWFLMAAALWEGWKGRANREAQPVAIGEVRLGQQDDVGCFPSARVICLHEQADWDNFPDGTKLYTAPPAPAVPEEISSSIRHLKDTLVACNRFNYCADAVNRVEDACRAAMLAQPVSSGYKLPPHVFRELVNSLRDTAVQFSGTEQLRERLNTTLHQFIEPDHPHTRTVAPEGGSGSSST